VCFQSQFYESFIWYSQTVLNESYTACQGKLDLYHQERTSNTSTHFLVLSKILLVVSATYNLGWDHNQDIFILRSQGMSIRVSFWKCDLLGILICHLCPLSERWRLQRPFSQLKRTFIRVLVEFRRNFLVMN